MQGCVLDAWLPHTAARIASIHPRLTGRIVAATRCVVLPPNPALGERDPLLCSTLNREKRKARSVSGKRRLSGPNPPEIAVRCDGCGLRSRPVRDAPPLQFHSRVDHTRPSFPVSRTRGLVCGEACMLFAFPKRCLTTPPNPATKINSHKPTEPAVRWAAIHAGEHCSQPQNEKPPVSTHPHRDGNVPADLLRQWKAVCCNFWSVYVLVGCGITK
jgi:hypothetical protein